jgi:hypothetical protein
LRVLADDQIAYEADAILLVEREGDERTVTPIIKPPRPAHLKMNKRYPATLASLFPDQVPDGEQKPKGGASGGKSKAAAPDVAEAAPSPAPAPEPPPEPEAAAPATGTTPPRDAAEAERRFFARYGEVLGGNTWNVVQRYLGNGQPKPTTVEGWISVAEQVRDRSRSGSAIAA